MAISVEYDFYASRDGRAKAADMLARDETAFEDGESHVAYFDRAVRGETWTDPLGLPDMRETADEPVCPTGYGIITDLGFDIAAMTMVTYLGCDVALRDTGLWPHTFGPEAGIVGLRISAPLAPGILWESGCVKGRGLPETVFSQASILILSEYAHIPDTVMTGLVGRPLDSFLRHPRLVSAADARIASVDPCDPGEGEGWYVRLSADPRQITLREARRTIARRG